MRKILGFYAYIIAIKNEGNVTGRVTKIVDNKPQGMEFVSELNSTWVQMQDGTIQNTELKDTNIKPGETREMLLVLRKKMTEENLGILNNVAQIAEAVNDQGIEPEYISDEKDLNAANLVVSIKTGEIAIYVTFGIAMAAMLGVGIYFINKKVLK